MYRILIADDEGIMLLSMQTMIQKNCGELCEVYTAKTGRVVADMAENIRPDIIFMDIQMPGMNGIEAMQIIRKANKTVLFIVITAYNKFDYAKDSIEIGVFDFLTKPVSKDNFLKTLHAAMSQVDLERKNRIANLRIREKLETVVPIIESGFINNLLLHSSEGTESDCYNYRELLEIREEDAYVILLQFGEDYENGELTNPVGMSMRAQKFYPILRQLVKKHFECMVGGLMGNKVILMVPEASEIESYEERIKIIAQARKLLHDLEAQIDARFRIGIGYKYRINLLNQSYQEAFRALQEGEGRVVHVGDMPIRGEFEEDYPEDNELLIFQMILKGEVGGAREQATLFFNWMTDHYPDYMDSIKLKVLELVMRAEKNAFWNGGLNYGFLYRKDYLPDMLQYKSFDEIRSWWLNKVTELAKNMSNRKKNQSQSIVAKAISYLDKNFNKDISLDEVSREVNINPYYFSKRFKEETGVNFIDYLTGMRIRKAKELLENPELSIKEICTRSGYSDPNYFSRIFKKIENVTPSEYRENNRSCS